MKKLLLTVLLFAFALVGFSQTPTDGDYRSKASGTWSTIANWQVRSGGTWANAAVVPTAANSVYIQDVHTITVDVANANCKDLQINITGGVAIGTNILNVNGKIRAFSGVAETSGADGVLYTNPNSTSLAVSMITTVTPGVLKFVGGTRNITEVGEWAATATNNDVEFALNLNTTGTINETMKFNNYNITSGIISAASTARLVVSNDITIKSGARLISARSGTAGTIIGGSSTTKSNIFTIDAGGILELTGATPAIDVTTFTNNGTVSYSKAGTQTLLQKGSDGTSTTALNAYKTLVLSNTSTKTPFASITVSELLQFNGTATLAPTASLTLTMLNGSTVERNSISGTQIPNTAGAVFYGTTSSDLVNVTIGSSLTNSNEIIQSPTPGKVGTLTINSGVTYTFLGSRPITNLVNNGFVTLAPTTTLTFTINGNIFGSGLLNGNINASIAIGGISGGNAGILNFNTGNQLMNFLTINRTGANASITIGTNVTVNGNITLTSGVINIPPSINLSVLSTTSFNAGSSASYLNTQTSGSNVGKIIIPGVAASKTIPVGNGNTYLPITLVPVSTSDFSINVFQAATTNAQPNGTALTAGQKADIVDAIYNITRTSGTGSCDVTLGWDATLEGTNFSGFPDAGLGVAQYNGTTYGTFVGPGDNTANTITTTVSSFNPFLIGKVGTLPVKLISFTAKAANQTSVLNWETKSEINLSKYEVQRSADGVTFETLGSVKANNASGVFNYSFIDKSPAFGANYYRLLSIDLDGTSAISNMQAVNFGTVATLSVYPNPTKGEINIAGLIKGDLITITDMIGRSVQSQLYIGENVMRLNLDKVNTGVYLLSVYRNGQITSSNRIIKN